MAGPIELLESATVGLAVGTAAADAFTPALESARQTAWTKHQVAVIDPGTAAGLVAQGITDLTAAYEQASRSGYSNNMVDALVQAALTAPGVSEGLTMLRRGFITTEQFTHFLRKAKFEPLWDAALLELQQNVLPVPDIALGLVRSNVKNEDAAGNPIVPNGLSSAGSTIEQFAPYPIDPETEAGYSGMNLARFKVIANNVGLPPGVVEGLQMLNRGYITEADFALLVEQSDLRIAWGPAIIKLAQAVFTAHEAADLRLRGYIDTPTMYKLGALEGYTEAQMDLMLDDIGRPLAVHQVTTGLSRGGVWTGEDQTAPQPYLAALEQSNIKPPWYSLAYANRFTYPGYFVLKPLVASGAITVDQATTYLLYQGWEPELAALTAESFASTAATKPKTATAATLLSEYEAGQMSQADTQTALAALGYTPQAIDIEIAHADYALAKRYQSAASKALESEYLAYRIDTPTATSQLEAAGYTPTAVQYALAEWNILRGANLKTLTAAQIRVAVHKGVLDQADATTELENQGYTAADANTYLNS